MRSLLLVAIAFGVACPIALAEEDPSLFIGLRRDPPAAQKPAPAAESKPADNSKKRWFKAGISDAAFHTDALAVARLLASSKDTPYEIDEAKEAVSREKERCAKEFVWMLNWQNCPDAATRRGAIAGISLCAPEGKVVGKPLALSAVYEPDADAKKASIALVKSRKDMESARALITTWKSAFDEQGILPANETTCKAAVDAMREIADKRTYQALLYYAMLEIRAGAAELKRVDNVAITGQGIRLPIDLPVLELRGVEGTIIVPAMASLKGATGQDFGRNFDKWKDWINKLP